MRATKQDTVFILDAVPHYSAATVVAGRGEGMYRTFEAVENVRVSRKYDLEGLVIIVATDFTHRECFARIVSHTTSFDCENLSH